MLERKVTAVVEEVEKLDEERWEQECTEGNEYVRLYRTETPGVTRGLKREFHAFIEHVRKGCHEDPFDSMHVLIDPDDEFSDLYCFRGTSNVESVNHIINKLVAEILQMSADFCHKKMWLKATSINLNKD